MAWAVGLEKALIPAGSRRFERQPREKLMRECKSQPPRPCPLANVVSKSLILKEWCSSWHLNRATLNRAGAGLGAEMRMALPGEG